MVHDTCWPGQSTHSIRGSIPEASSFKPHIPSAALASGASLRANREKMCSMERVAQLRLSGRLSKHNICSRRSYGEKREPPRVATRDSQAMMTDGMRGWDSVRRWRVRCSASAY